MSDQLIGRESELPINKDVKWYDCSDFIRQTCSQMSRGEMIHAKDFQLSKVMSAVEIMDGKMDTGIHYDKNVVLTVEKRLANDSLPLKISVRHCLEIMDCCLRCEVSWFSGLYLTQSIFTCLYISIIDKLDFKFIRNYLKMFLKCNEYVHKLMELKGVSREVKEEEEFYSKTYDNQIAYDFDEQELMKICKELENELNCRIEEKECKFKPFQNDDEKIEGLICKALLNRLKFRRILLTLHQLFDNKSDEKLLLVNDLVNQGLKALKIMKKQHKKLKLSMDEPVLGFDQEYTKLIHTIGPQKPRKLCDWNTAYQTMSDYLVSLRELPVLKSFDTLHQFRNFFYFFSLSKPNVIPRVRLWGIYSIENKKEISMDLMGGKFNYHNFVKHDLQTWYGFSEKFVSRITESNEVKVLVGQIAMCNALYFNYFCFNRSKLRRKLTILIMDHLSKVILNSSFVDTKLSGMIKGKTPVFKLYVTDFVLHLASTIFLLGFELDLFSNDEFAPVFSYLDYLAGCGVENAGEIKQGKADSKVPPIIILMERKYELHLILSKAFFRFTIFLEVSGYLKIKKFTYGSDSSRFRQRMEFLIDTKYPPPYKYENYSKAKVNFIKSFKGEEDMLKNVQDHFSAATTKINQILGDDSSKTLISETEKKFLNDINRIAKGNQISINIIKKLSETLKGRKERSEKKVLFDFTKGIYPIVKVK